MDSLLSHLANLSAGMILGYIIWAGLPIISLIACWRNQDRGTISKIAWTIFILLTWPLLAFGAAVFGLFNFRSMAGKVASIAAFGIALAGIVIMPIFSIKEIVKTGQIFQQKSLQPGQIACMVVTQYYSQQASSLEDIKNHLYDGWFSSNNNSSDLGARDKVSCEAACNEAVKSMRDDAEFQKKYTGWSHKAGEPARLQTFRSICTLGPWGKPNDEMVVFDRFESIK